MKHVARRLGLAPLVLMAAMAGQARADLYADSIRVDFLNPDQSTQVYSLGAKIVSPTATFHDTTAGFTLDVAASTITITYTDHLAASFVNPPFTGYRFTDTTENTGVTGVTIDAATGAAGFVADDVSFTDREIFVNLHDTGFLRGQSIVLDLGYGPLAAAAAPEPSSALAVAFAALAGLGMGARQRWAARA